jgi:hypothetical protein
MVEMTFNFSNEGIPINEANIELASFRLLSLFLADKEIQKLKAKNRLQIADEIIGLSKYDQITHLLVEIATLYRIRDNQIPKTDEYNQVRRNRIVGSLFEPIDSKRQDLTIREACNKIIHSETINFDIKKLSKSRRAYLSPIIYWYGVKNKNDWKAVVDIVDFCAYSVIPLKIDLLEKLEVIEL